MRIPALLRPNTPTRTYLCFSQTLITCILSPVSTNSVCTSWQVFGSTFKACNRLFSSRNSSSTHGAARKEQMSQLGKGALPLIRGRGSHLVTSPYCLGPTGLSPSRQANEALLLNIWPMELLFFLLIIEVFFDVHFVVIFLMCPEREYGHRIFLDCTGI